MKQLYFLIGAPGVGKSTFLKKRSQVIFGNNELLLHVVSPDNLRSMVESPKTKPDGTFGISQENEKYVWGIVNDIIAKKANRGELIIVDATHSRNTAISAYKKYADMGYRVTAIDFSDFCSVETAILRNSERINFRRVPEKVVRTIYERCASLDVPSWVEVIKPKDFVEHFYGPKYNYDNYDQLNFFGDIHGCPEELEQLWAGVGITNDAENITGQKTMNVYVGDYFDRGYDVVKIFRLLQKFQDNNDVLFIKGNHEEPLEHYRAFYQDMTKYLHEKIDSLNDLFARREQLLEDSKAYEEELQELTNPSTWYDKAWLRFEKLRAEGSSSRDFKISVVDAQLSATNELLDLLPEIEPEALKFIKEFRGRSYKQLDSLVHVLGSYPKANEWLIEKVKMYNLPKELIKDPVYGFHKIKRTSLGTMKRFLLSDILYIEVSEFVKRLAQMFDVDFHGTRVICTHGGITTVPTKATPTSDMVRGVGGYDDSLTCDETFHKLNPGVIGIHGHRNLTNLPIATTEGTFNINGDVDLGLRAVTLHKDKTIETTEIMPKDSTMKYYREAQLKKAKQFKAKKLTVDEEGTGLLKMFQDHTHVNLKKLPEDIVAINFTKKAFEKGIWDDVTIKARGLFAAVDNPDNPTEIKVIARGYEKFFNLGERYGFDTRDVRNLAFPLRAYEKANGYLGLLSVDTRGETNTWFTSSKSTTLGDFADNFRRLISPYLNDELMDIMVRDNVTLVFEVIDPIFDPHIEEYPTEELVLLDAIKNQIEFETINYEMLDEYIEVTDKSRSSGLRKKKLIKICETYNDWYSFVKEVNQKDFLSNNGEEGHVFEDSDSPRNMFKTKTKWYSFWKYMRTVKDRIANRIQKNIRKGQPAVLNKSQLVDLKKGLHIEEDIKVFNFMQALAEKDFEVYQKMSIIDVRNAYIETSTLK